MSGKIVIAGGTGFLGNVLATYFRNLGYEVIILTRRPRWKGDVYWDGKNAGDWTKHLEAATAVINLAGRSVDCRYHARNRRLILESRVFSTRAIGEAIAQCKTPPAIWLNASTATIYKHTFDRAWDENGTIGDTPEARDKFSIEVACAWEHEFNRAHTPFTRKVALRTAMVLGTGPNSVFPVLTRLVRFGLGGKMGHGNQFVSWIHQSDFCRAIHWIIEHKDLEGVINLCAPEPLTNCEMMAILRQLCCRSIGLPAKAWMLELGAFFLRTETELIIKSRRVIPGRLQQHGFRFQYSTFREAAANLLQSSDCGHRYKALPGVMHGIA